MLLRAPEGRTEIEIQDLPIELALSPSTNDVFKPAALRFNSRRAHTSHKRHVWRCGRATATTISPGKGEIATRRRPCVVRRADCLRSDVLHPRPSEPTKRITPHSASTGPGILACKSVTQRAVRSFCAVLSSQASSACGTEERCSVRDFRSAKDVRRPDAIAHLHLRAACRSAAAAPTTGVGRRSQRTS